MREREKQQSVASHPRPDWNRTHNLGMRPDQELNLQLFGVRDDAPTNWATQPGKANLYLVDKILIWDKGSEKNWI